MTSPTVEGVGRLFPDVESVCQLVSAGRTAPLASEIVYADFTGSLAVLQFAEALEDLGYSVPEPIVMVPEPSEYEDETYMDETFSGRPNGQTPGG